MRFDFPSYVFSLGGGKRGEVEGWKTLLFG